MRGSILVSATFSALILPVVAFAQVRVEGLVRWADASPAAGVTVVLSGFAAGERGREPEQRAITDEGGSYVFEKVRPGIRASLEASLGTRVIGSATTLVSLRVERVDIVLIGTAARPFEAAPPSARRTAPSPAVSASEAAGGAAATVAVRSEPVNGPQEASATERRLGGTVTGQDGLPLPGATVSVVGTTTSTVTDERGQYTLTLTSASKELVLVADLMGYRSADAVVSAATAVTDFRLTAAFSEAVTVIAEVPALNAAVDVSRVELSPAQVAVLPSLGAQDIFRAFQLLPGVSGSNETSSGLYVRGGRPDQNLIQYDGFRIYHVDHLFGYFSAFNMDAIEAVELTKGGFEAEFGGALSSVLQIRGKRGRSDRLGGSAGISLLSANGLLEVPLFRGTGSALVAARRSYQGPLYNRIVDLFSSGGATGAPRAPAGANPGGPFAATFDSQPSSSFYDLNGKVTLKPSNDDQVHLTAYRGNDDVDNSRRLELPAGFLDQLRSRGVDPAALGFDLSAPAIDITDVQASGNVAFGGVWSRQWTTRLQSEVSVGFSQFEDIRDRRTQTGSTGTPSAENNRLRDVTFKASLPFSISPGHTVEAGIEVTRNDYDYAFQNAALPNAGTPLLTVLDRAGEGSVTSAYLQDRWLLGGRLNLVPGVRVSTFDGTGEGFVDPRLAATLFVSDRIKVKFASGRFHQFTSRVTREDLLQGNRAFWAVADGVTVPVSSATHFIGGVSYERGSVLVDVEAFDKRTSGLSQFAPRLTTSGDNVPFEDLFYRGESASDGVEVLVQKRSGAHSGWVSYTFNRVLDTFPGLASEPFQADQSSRHELKVVGVANVRNWNIATTWVGATGKPYTEPVGFEAVATFGGRTVNRVLAGEKNGGRLPGYHRLDFALTREVPLGQSGAKGAFGATLFNAYNRTNVWYKEFNVVESEITENNIRLMGRTFNVSLSVKF